MIKPLLTALLLMTSTASMANDDANVVGRYRLVNQMEAAAELLLKQDHTFQWGMIVGSADLKANGTWSVNDGVLEIKTPERPALAGSPEFVPFTDDDMKWIRQVPSNFWQVVVAVKGVGGVADIAVVVETRDHKRYQATTELNGLATVFKDDGEQLARVGLRWLNDSADYTWFDVPEQQVAKKTAAFWVTDPQWAAKQPFERLEFTVENDLLISTSDNMTYQKIPSR
ncbi:hypothetical protein L9G15_05115 [Shewanella sp. A3A]|nr:hypothetical protein [Shewanella ferrihydritica]